MSDPEEEGVQEEQGKAEAKVAVTFDEDKNTQLHFAAARGDVQEVLRLVDGGHKVDVENGLGWTALMMATRNGHVDVIKLLLERRADATRKNKFGGSIFMMAIAAGNLDIVHTILQHLLCGGVSKQSMENWFSPLSIAILFNHEKVFTYLLEKGFNHNATTPITGLTPSMYAAINDNQTFIGILLNKGADQKKKNINNESAEDLLKEKNKKRGLHHPKKQPQVVPAPAPPPPPPPLEIPKIVVFNPQPPIISPFPQPPPPTPNYIQVHRKSSNVMTPNFCYTPNISPISPIVFFPPDFSPQILPHHRPFEHFSFINATYGQLSPMITVAYPPPNDSVHFREHNGTFFEYPNQTIM